MKFEEAMQNLEKIVLELEKGDLDLDTSMEKFEEGMKLSKECNKILQEKEKKITVLIKEGEQLKEENFVPKE